jgi:scyllo-inosamine-4-phosphate amidinotransferase 1
MLSTNEWDPLLHVIVGRADGARIPEMDNSLRTINYGNLRDVSQVPVGLYPQSVIDEANQDLENLSDFFKSCNIKVSRPDLQIMPEYYYFCPRDSMCVFENLVISSPMPLRSRKNESRALHHIFENLDADFDWISLQAKRKNSLYDLDCVCDPDRLALTEIEACFDAANVLRANNDVFYLVSNSGNRKGAKLLQRLLGDAYRVWPIENIYAYMHIDSTICFLKEGLMLLNPERIKDTALLPKPLQNWDVIWAPDPGDVWHHPGWCNSSRWVSMNIFSVSPDLVIVERNQEALARSLNSHGIECAMLDMKHARTLGGSFHCVTLDIERNHGLGNTSHMEP